jgi:hypothetical protein
MALSRIDDSEALTSLRTVQYDKTVHSNKNGGLDGRQCSDKQPVALLAKKAKK